MHSPFINRSHSLTNSTNRSHLSNDSKQKEPFLFLSSNRYSTNASECSENFNVPESNSTHTNTFSQMSNRTKAKVSSRESSAMDNQRHVLRPQQSYPQQRVNFEKSVSRKTRPSSNFSKSILRLLNTGLNSQKIKYQARRTLSLIINYNKNTIRSCLCNIIKEKLWFYTIEYPKFESLYFLIYCIMRFWQNFY